MTAELKGYVREGVSLWLDGQRCSPGRAASACLLQEDSCYMRDYVCDEQNRVVAIHFDRVEPEEERSLPYGRGYAGFSGSRRNQGPGMPPRRYGRNARTEPCGKTKTGKHEILVRKESADRNDSSVMRTAPGAKTKRRRECPYMGHSFCLENQKRFARILAKTEKMYYDKQTTSFSRRNGSWHR